MLCIVYVHVCDNCLTDSRLERAEYLCPVKIANSAAIGITTPHTRFLQKNGLEMNWFNTLTTAGLHPPRWREPKPSHEHQHRRHT